MKILVASPIHSHAIERLTRSHDVRCIFNEQSTSLLHEISDCEVLIFRSGVDVTAEVMQTAPNLQLLVRAGSGFDNIDLDYVRQRDLCLVRVPGPGARAVAEMAFALMLALARQLLRADQAWRGGHWVKHEIEGYLLQGKVLGIIGAGNIGSKVGKLGAAWGMDVIGCVEYLTEEISDDLRQKGIRPTSCIEVLSKADFISVHVPLTDATQHMIGEAAFARMKPGAFLINLARGGVVDEAALLRALEQGRIKGAALDVHVKEGEGNISPLAELPNVILTPHIGAMTEDTQVLIGERIVEIVADFSRQNQAQNCEHLLPVV